MLALLTAALSLATFIETLDMTIANVAVPAIAGAMGVSTSQGTWVISSYTVGAAIAVPLTGWLSTRVGEARLFMLSLFMFTAASAACAMASNMSMLISFRALQGLLSGPMVPLSQTLLLRAFPQEKRGLALSLWGLTVLLAPIFGPVVGGWLVDNYSWHWIFLINVPIGIAALAVCSSLLPADIRDTRKKPTAIDLIGMTLLVIGVGSLQAALDLGHQYDWFESIFIKGLLIVAALMLGALVIWERGERHPVVDLSLFRDPNYSMSLAIIAIGMMGFALIGVVFPLWLQTVMQYSAFRAGLAMAPFGVLALVFAALIGQYGERLDPRIIASFGFVVFCLSLLWDTRFTINMSFWQIAAPGFILGIGLPCFFIPMTNVMLSRVPDAKLASATGLFNFLRTLSFGFGTSISATLWDNRGEYHYGVLAHRVSNEAVGTTNYLTTLHSYSLPNHLDLFALQNTARQQAYMLATNDMFLMTSLLCALLAASVWLTRPKRGQSMQIVH